MTFDGIRAYDVPDRIVSYDADMDVMHPNRRIMTDLLLDFLPLDDGFDRVVLELGSGTGFLSQKVLEAYPRARVIGVEGADAMIVAARERLGPLSERVELRLGDFRALDRHLGSGESFGLVVTSFALHHLNREEKEEVVRTCVARMEPGAWLLNADLIAGDNAELEARFQERRVAGILRRARPGDERFADEPTVCRLLDDLEANEGDQPVPVRDDVDILTRAGLESATVLWLEYREAVTAGRKPPAAPGPGFVGGR